DDKTNWAIGKVVLILLGSLIPIWMFSIPILIFAPSFAGVTALLYFLLWTPSKGERENILVWLLLLLGLLYFYSTSINVAAFTLYFVETIILALILKPKQLSISIITKKAVAVALVWLAIVQVILILRPHPPFVLTEALHYGRELAQDAKSAEVTSSLIEMETQRNSIVNVARFATGWLSLTDGQEKNLSSYKNYIDSIPGIIITLAPAFLICYFLFSQWKKQTVATRNLAVAWGVAIFLCTSYALIFTQTIPYVGVILRWVSSKLWPLLFFPSIILLYKALSAETVQKTAKNIVYIGLGITALPWLFGIVNKHQQVSFPTYYTDAIAQFTENDSVLYLPEPQRLYMRQYNWGYYGSSFLTYLTNAKILDNGSFHPEQNIYPALTDDYKNCNVTSLKRAISVIVIDNSTIAGTISLPSCYDTFTKTQVGDLTIIRL
ncbi:hypothetical protein COZ14_03925, partial [Candidatus Dojkabacteria bacterium CG_4_10_14_3_um_filter_Dojkabacteria_WS6_41_9]